MIVIDASCMVELLIGTSVGRRVAARIADPAEGLHIPHLLDVEVTQTLRRLAREGQIEPADATLAIAALRSLDLTRHAHHSLLDRVWALRANLSAYDAIYVALAEALQAVLLTSDRKLASAPGVSRRVELIV